MDLFDLAGAQTELPEARCSRKGCTRTARWDILWNNPKIHRPERLKIWLACDEHKEWLEEFLRVRNFYRESREHRAPSEESRGAE